MKNTKLFYGIFVLVIAVMGLSGCSKSPVKTQVECGIENCHGLDITCGRNVPDACDMMYALGDNCRQYASCEVIDGKCQLAKSDRFEQCKACVEKCETDFPDDPTNAFACEGECVG